MAFQDLREVLHETVLPLPIGGRVYTVQQCSAEDWLWMHDRAERMEALIKAGNLDAPAEGEETKEIDMYRRALGSTFEQMVTGGVTGKELLVAAWTAYFWHLGSQEMAEAIWLNAGKAMGMTNAEVEVLFKPNRAARRAPAKKAPAKKVPAKRVSSRSTGSPTRRAIGA